MSNRNKESVARRMGVALALFAVALSGLTVSCKNCEDKGCNEEGGGGTGTTSSTTGTTTYTVYIDELGSFDPPELVIHDGDTVEWVLHDRRDSVIQADWTGDFPAVCSSPRAYDAADLAGPTARAPSGVYSLGPDEKGFEETPCLVCDDGTLKCCTDAGGAVHAAAANADGVCLCPTGTDRVSMDATWESESITGVFIRFRWSDVHLAPGTDDSSFDFEAVDAEIEKAVKHGKLYSLAFKAGADGTPSWIFDNGVTPVKVRNTDTTTCGQMISLGDPTDPVYQGHYFDLLRKVASHLKTRADWYRALAYIKPSGANLFTHENRLPNGCSLPADCDVCNNEVWALAGYTPTGLHGAPGYAGGVRGFYGEQTKLIAEEFPDKDMSYALIQAGFPIVNDQGAYEMADGMSSDGSVLPSGTQQTKEVLDNCWADLGWRFAIQHNGLGPGSANTLVASAPPGQVTGFQTNNDSKVGTPELLQETFGTLRDEAPQAVFMEIYEQRLWEAERTNNGLLVPDDAQAMNTNTVAEWNELLHARRTDAAIFPDLPDPFPLTFSHTFHRTIPSGPETLYYIHGAKCASAPQGWGSIVIE